LTVSGTIALNVVLVCFTLRSMVGTAVLFALTLSESSLRG
jgi:hypothetical protein